MSHISFYRKWRPKTFNDVKGQDAVVQILENQIKFKNLSHAYLFCGTRGTGKTSIAKIFAMAINCDSPVGSSPCYKCKTCKALMDNNLDVSEVDAASNNGVEYIRRLTSDVEYRPTVSKYKVYIIDEAHMLTTNAFNALLKTLEEPPEYVIFILATTEINKIPATILSRCQRYDFLRIDTRVITSRLNEVVKSEGIKISLKAIEYIAKLADGALRDALSILEQCASLKSDDEVGLDDVLTLLGRDNYEVYHQIFNFIITSDSISVNKKINKLISRGKTALVLIGELSDYIKNIAFMQMSRDYIDDLSPNEYEVISQDVDKVGNEYLHFMLINLLDLQENLKHTENKRMLVELGMLKLMLPRGSGDDLVEVLARVEAVENRISNLKFVTETVNNKEDEDLKLKDDVYKINEICSPTSQDIKNISLDTKQVIDRWDDFLEFLSKQPDQLLRSTLAQAKLNLNNEELCLIFEKTLSKDVVEKKRENVKMGLLEFYKKDINFRIKLIENNNEDLDIRKFINWNFD